MEGCDERYTKYLVANIKSGKVVHCTPPVRCPPAMILVFPGVKCTGHSAPVAVRAFCMYLH